MQADVFAYHVEIRHCIPRVRHQDDLIVSLGLLENKRRSREINIRGMLVLDCEAGNKNMHVLHLYTLRTVSAGTVQALICTYPQVLIQQSLSQL